MILTILGIAFIAFWMRIGYEMNQKIEIDDQFADGMERDEYGNPILKD